MSGNTARHCGHKKQIHDFQHFSNFCVLVTTISLSSISSLRSGFSMVTSDTSDQHCEWLAPRQVHRHHASCRTATLAPLNYG